MSKNNIFSSKVKNLAQHNPFVLNALARKKRNGANAVKVVQAYYFKQQQNCCQDRF